MEGCKWTPIVVPCNLQKNSSLIQWVWSLGDDFWWVIQFCFVFFLNYSIYIFQDISYVIGKTSGVDDIT